MTTHLSLHQRARERLLPTLLYDVDEFVREEVPAGGRRRREDLAAAGAATLE
ncbi:MAG: hypothetical protein M3379_17090 [Acidobacteriota bacterium]|nr:hypothetical protein [Acidobacteriota bacterium]